MLANLFFVLFECFVPIVTICAAIAYCVWFYNENKKVAFSPSWYVLFAASMIFAVLGLMWLATS